MKSISSLFTCLLVVARAGAAEWPQYHGANSDKKAQEVLASTSWLKNASSQLWKIKTPLGFSSFSVSGGLAYTLIGRQDEDGLPQEVRVALEVASGRVKWSKNGYGPGNVILAGDKLIALFDTGELAVVSANPSGYKELARSKVFARSTKEAVCLKVGR